MLAGNLTWKSQIVEILSQEIPKRLILFSSFFVFGYPTSWISSLRYNRGIIFRWESSVSSENEDF